MDFCLKLFKNAQKIFLRFSLNVKLTRLKRLEDINFSDRKNPFTQSLLSFVRFLALKNIIYVKYSLFPSLTFWPFCISARKCSVKKDNIMCPPSMVHCRLPLIAKKELKPYRNKDCFCPIYKCVKGNIAIQCVLSKY